MTEMLLFGYYAIGFIVATIIVRKYRNLHLDGLDFLLVVFVAWPVILILILLRGLVEPIQKQLVRYIMWLRGDK